MPQSRSDTDNNVIAEETKKTVINIIREQNAGYEWFRSHPVFY